MLFLGCFCWGKTSLADGLICVLSLFEGTAVSSMDIPGLFTKPKSLQEEDHKIFKASFQVDFFLIKVDTVSNF